MAIKTIQLNEKEVLFLNNMATELQLVMDKIMWENIRMWYPETVDKKINFDANSITLTYDDEESNIPKI